MREIKFRAWDRDQGFMHNDVLVDGDGTVYTSASEVYSTPNREIEGYTQDQGFLMQYTGKKDKNGQEIYEGDIVRTSHWNKDTVSEEQQEQSRKNYEIIFSDHYGQWTGKNGDLETTMGIYCRNDIVVIGNIYENPELLNK